MEQHAVVTGGASGIGAAVVKRLVARGLRVSVFDVNLPAAQTRDESSAVRAA